VQLLVVLLRFLVKESCRQIDGQELLFDSMEGGAGGPAAWWSLDVSLAAKIFYLKVDVLNCFTMLKSSKVEDGSSMTVGIATSEPLSRRLCAGYKGQIR
jgi:hypothetical protein